MRRPARLALLGLLAAGAGVGCGSSGSPSASAPDAGADGGPADDARTPVVIPRGVALAPYIDVEKTASTCADPMGTPITPTSLSEAVSLLAGRWRRCSGAFAGPTPDGWELDRDRRWLALETSGSALVPATGNDSEAVWFLGGEAAGPIDGGPPFEPGISPPPRVDTDLQLLFVDPTTIKSSMLKVELFQRPTGLRVAGVLTFVWVGD